MDWSKCEVVEAVPGRCGGMPVLRGTRMRADFVFENYLLGDSSEEQVEQYGLDLADVEAVIEHAVLKYIEIRKHADSAGPQCALGTAQAA